MTKNIIVTGGAGYIGSHACKALSHANFTPVTIDNLSTGWNDAVKFGPLEIVDLNNKEGLNTVFKKYDPIAVMHFAASSEVGESILNPGKYWANNLMGSLNLIEIALKHKCKDFVFSSTCATYGNHDNVILTEQTTQLPTNAYGASKRAVEEMIHHFAAKSNLNFVIFRYFNVAGADPDAEIGEFHRPETHLIPSIFDSLMGKRNALTIYGTDYDTPDGTCVRDYIHVCDLVDAHVLGLSLLLEKSVNRIFNLGTGQGFSVLEIIKNIEIITNKKVPYIEGSKREGDCAKLVSSSERAMAELGWIAIRSSLLKIIEDAWRWHKSMSYTK